MQPTQTQVERSLEALRAPSDGPAATGASAPHDLNELPDDVLHALLETPSVRSERLAEVQRRLEAGEQPSADDLARRMVGRLVCDRLR